ncbi:hypothetical protein ACH9EU_01900, partial [Kocuria sp. M1R5S2]|uniref:hypothetical protein n=1 Tax=Kocuria rhizosphaerae TaxID=3376285 RepID=UPI0037B6A079
GRLRRGWEERGRPAAEAVRSNLLGTEVTGAHMVVCLLDSAVLGLSHRRLGELEPRLAETARAVLRTKERHVAFFGEEAAARLSVGGRSRRPARTAVARWNWPGTHRGGPASAAAAARRLFAGAAAEEAVLDLDRATATLPGLSGVRPVHTALVRIRRGETVRNADRAA